MNQIETITILFQTNRSIDRMEVSQQVANVFQRLLEINNPAQFRAKFNGQNRETLPFIFSIDKFTRINGIQDPDVLFQRIFNTLDGHYQDLFIEDHTAEEALDIPKLKLWLLKKYPPPPMKHEWLHKLKSIIMRKN